MKLSSRRDLLDDAQVVLKQIRTRLVKEDTVDNTFGKIAFGGPKDTGDGTYLDHNDMEKVKQILQLQNKSEIEDNTQIEMEIIRNLNDWVYGSTEKRSNILYSHLNVIKAAANKFPEIFKPVTKIGTPLYRGVRHRNIESILIGTDKNDYEQINFANRHRPFWKYKRPITYTPHRLLQSWTDYQSVAVSFSDMAILMTNQDTDFFFSQRLLGILRGDDYESETIHFGREYKNDVYLIISDEIYLESFK